MKEISFYVHIPFCVSKCKYCAFLSFTNKEKFFEIYVKRLKEEILSYKERLADYEVKTIFVGGGTPSILPPELLEEIIALIKNNFKISKDCEITSEANPESFNFEKAKIWKRCGVNRISFGLQSDDDLTLKQLGRPHTFNDFLDAISFAKKANFKNINADILLGTSGQTEEKIKSLIEKLSKLDLTHVSAYGLMLEEGTPLFLEVKQKKVILPTEEQQVSLYNTAVKTLKQFGFNRYEISNFSKPNFESKHNKNYWNRGEFLGFGVGAYSFFKGEHFNNTQDLKSYLKDDLKRENIEKESLETAKKETIMLSLRTEKGLDIEKFNNKFNEDFLKTFRRQIEKLKNSNLIKIEKGFLSICDFEVSNYIISEFF